MPPRILNQKKPAFCCSSSLTYSILAQALADSALLYALRSQEYIAIGWNGQSQSERSRIDCAEGCRTRIRGVQGKCEQDSEQPKRAGDGGERRGGAPVVGTGHHLELSGTPRSRDSGGKEEDVVRSHGFVGGKCEDVDAEDKEKWCDDHRGENRRISEPEKSSDTLPSPSNVVSACTPSSFASSSHLQAPLLSTSQNQRRSSPLPRRGASSPTTLSLSSRRSHSSPSSTSDSTFSSRSLHSSRSTSRPPPPLSTISESLPLHRTQLSMTVSRTLHALGLAVFGTVFLICIGVLLYVSPVSGSVPHLAPSGGTETLGRGGHHYQPLHRTSARAHTPQRRDGGTRE